MHYLLDSFASAKLWDIPSPRSSFRRVNFSPLEVSVAGINFIDAPRGWPPELLDVGFIVGLVAFTALGRDREAGIRTASTSQGVPTQQVVGNGHSMESCFRRS